MFEFNFLAQVKPVVNVVTANQADNDEYMRKTDHYDVYGYPCNYLFEFADGTTIKNGPDICHHALQGRDLKGKVPSAFVTSLWLNPNGPLCTRYDEDDDYDDDNGKEDTTFRVTAERFWTWLLGDDSPYKEVIKDREIIYRKDGSMCAVRLPNGCNVPGPILGNFCIFSRWPREHAKFTDSWAQYVDAGFTGTEAVFMAHHVHFQGDKSIIGPEFGHYPFDHAMSWKVWSSGKPITKVTKPYHEERVYRPCNAVWNDGGNTYAYGNKVGPDPYERGVYKVLKANAQYMGSFPNLYKVVNAGELRKGGLKVGTRQEVLAKFKAANRVEIFSGA